LWLLRFMQPTFVGLHNERLMDRTVGDLYVHSIPRPLDRLRRWPSY
jgi:hypothetical protein